MTIQIKGITKRFGAFTALNNVAAEFPRGVLTALLGPSGCGKTTLLRIIAGLEIADAGRILIDGDDATRRHVRERQVGFVFQHYALFRHMSVFENVAFGLRVRPRKLRPSETEIRKKVMELLDLVQLAWLANRSPAQLSGGQRQRIALARALAVEPQVLLLDEPFGALDAKVRKELRSWLRKLHDTLHITSIFVTHDQEEALELADQVVVMNNGAIEQVGTPKQVYENPANSFVYGFLGSSNILRGSVANGIFEGHGARLRLERANGAYPEALAFIRPHEMSIVRQTSDPNRIEAHVRRILEFGPLARIELSANNSEQAFEVETPQQNLRALNLRNGDTVYLVPDRIRVFPAAQASH